MEFERALEQVVQQGIDRLPELVLAVVLLLVGLLVAWLLQLIAELALRNLGLDGFAERSGLAQALKGATRTEITLTQLIGRIAFWTVFLYFLASALETVGLDKVAGLIMAVARFVPKVLGALLLTIGGLFAGKTVRALIIAGRDQRDVPEAWDRLGTGVQISVVVAAVLLALVLLGLDLMPLMWFLVVLCAAAGVIAVVGWGPLLRARSHDWLVARRLKTQVQAGDLVRVGEIEGFVVKIDDNHLVVQTTDGIVHLPIALLAGQPLTLLTTLPEPDQAELEMP